jgi:hypothetical protein
MGIKDKNVKKLKGQNVNLYALWKFKRERERERSCVLISKFTSVLVVLTFLTNRTKSIIQSQEQFRSRDFPWHGNHDALNELKVITRF